MFSNHKYRYQFLSLILILVFALAFAGCASGTSNNDNDSGDVNNVPNTGASGNGTTVNVTMTSYAFQLDNQNIPAGPVTFHVTNAAQDVEHELVVLKTDVPGDQLPKNDQGLVDEDQLQSLGEIEKEIGESGDLTVNLEPGHYVLLCNEPGHYDNGMYLDINVQ